MVEHGHFANTKERQNEQKWLIIGLNFDISKTYGKKELQKQFRVGLCKKKIAPIPTQHWKND